MLLTLALAGAVQAQTQSLPDLTGSWRLHYEVVTRNEVPVIGSLRSTSAAWVFATIEEREGKLVQTHRVCASGVSGGMVKTELSPAYIAHVPLKTYAVELEPVDGEVRFRADTGVFRTGFDPACGPVPESIDDPCVIDWDEDGHPGATVRVKPPMFGWAEVYVAQDNHLKLDGRVVSPDAIEGHVLLPRMATHVLGASNRLFARSPTAELVPELSRFTMTRLPDQAGCPEAVAGG